MRQRKKTLDNLNFCKKILELKIEKESENIKRHQCVLMKEIKCKVTDLAANRNESDIKYDIEKIVSEEEKKKIKK